VPSTSWQARFDLVTDAPYPAGMPGVDEEALAAARAGDETAFRTLVAPHLRELRAYCYRMAGSLDEADDLLQDSLLRAWRGLPSFEGRSSLRTWLYRVCWSACIDALEKRPPRVMTVDTGPPADPRAPIPPPRPEGWIGPCPPALWEEEHVSPEARYGQRESVAFAFLAALQLLPARQRAMLLARDVLGWSAQECADAFATTVASVNSALQRARETLEARVAGWRPRVPDEATTRALLSRYVDAWERADLGALAALLREESTLAMPPLPIWLRGRDAIAASIGGMVLTPETAGRFHFRETSANGLPALAAYERGPDGSSRFVALHVLELDEAGILSITAFLDPGLAATF
jgi:RNA polymerase sigma-70 factor, ECF subfamily